MFNFEKKVFNPFNKKLVRGRAYKVWFEIRINKNHITKGMNGEEIPNTGYYISFCGVEGALTSGNMLGGCGQIDCILKKENPNKLNFQKAYDEEFMNKFFDIWDKYHLCNIEEVPTEVVEFLNAIEDNQVNYPWH